MFIIHLENSQKSSDACPYFYGIEEFILKSSQIFILERMKKLILNDEMNYTVDLCKLYPTKEEINNIVWKKF